MEGNLSATSRNARALKITFALTFTYFLVEVAGGVLTGSLALLADAAHMLTDVGGLALALFAAWMARKPATATRSYGYYRVEILAALVNAVVLFGISFYILYEAYRRFRDPPSVASGPMLAVAALGLVVNLIGIWNLRRGSGESLNMQGAYLEVVSDLLGSIGVLIAGVIMLTTGWYYADPLFSVFIGLFILPRTWSLMMQAVNVLLEGTPAHIDVAAVQNAILRVPNVAAVHDLHVWTITSGVESLSAHIVLKEGSNPADAWPVIDAISARLKEDFKISHTTLQVEPPGREPEASAV